MRDTESTWAAIPIPASEFTCLWEEAETTGLLLHIMETSLSSLKVSQRKSIICKLFSGKSLFLPSGGDGTHVQLKSKAPSQAHSSPGLFKNASLVLWLNTGGELGAKTGDS